MLSGKKDTKNYKDIKIKQYDQRRYVIKGLAV